MIPGKENYYSWYAKNTTPGKTTTPGMQRYQEKKKLFLVSKNTTPGEEKYDSW